MRPARTIARQTSHLSDMTAQNYESLYYSHQMMMADYVTMRQMGIKDQLKNLTN